MFDDNDQIPERSLLSDFSDKGMCSGKKPVRDITIIMLIFFVLIIFKAIFLAARYRPPIFSFMISFNWTLESRNKFEVAWQFSSWFLSMGTISCNNPLPPTLMHA